MTSYRAFGRFIDGGLISNNPTLDVLTEIFEYNTTLQALGRESEAVQPSVVVSLGTGRPPVTRIDAIDCFKPESMWSTVQMAFGLSNVAKMLIDQGLLAAYEGCDWVKQLPPGSRILLPGCLNFFSNPISTTRAATSTHTMSLVLRRPNHCLHRQPATMADNRTVDRARAWCATCGIVYMRLSPQLSLDIQLDERQDEILVNALWESMVYIRSMKDKINRLANLLTLGCPQA
ncbi:85/ calcium-independent phospholipase A2 [Chionoecetes opilio]|uniref:85/ calcium-independent phospholipase A2 n=1 Tax=Chionoecetes opilio TaxID=41210 RepID=A0A8J5CF37_CHIOP|nr:85/ calcium-independent phospholipase A2 [Chionoecetes opilio]